MSDLVQRLSRGQHPVEVSLRPEKTLVALQECINRGYVHIKFTDTKGGTELGVRLDKDMTVVNQTAIDAKAGKAKFVGNLTLDYVKVRCIADIDLATLQGSGCLEVLPN